MDEPPGHLDLERGDAYGRSFGDVYDRWYHGVTDAEATADFVAARHPGGPVLELGVGTGRLARPLADRGLTVVGLDASADMLGSCPRSGRRPGGAGIAPVLADMRALPFAASGPAFGSILVAFNTLFNLTTEPDQAALLVDLAALVDRRGVVVVEMLDLSGLLDGPDRSIGLRPRPDDPDHGPVVVTATQLDRGASACRASTSSCPTPAPPSAPGSCAGSPRPNSTPWPPPPGSPSTSASARGRGPRPRPRGRR